MAKQVTKDIVDYSAANIADQVVKRRPLAQPERARRGEASTTVVRASSAASIPTVRSMIAFLCFPPSPRKTFIRPFKSECNRSMPVGAFRIDRVIMGLCPRFSLLNCHVPPLGAVTRYHDAIPIANYTVPLNSPTTGLMYVTASISKRSISAWRKRYAQVCRTLLVDVCSQP